MSLMDRIETAISLAFEGEGEAWSDRLSGDRLAYVARRAIEDAGIVEEPDWEYGAIYGDATYYGVNLGPSLAQAEATIEAWKGVGRIVRRTPEREPGEWQNAPTRSDAGHAD